MVETTRRQAIEDAASSLFHEHGYSGTSVRDIARAVDIQGASLYAHVASKQEVLWSIVERTASRFEAAADTVEAADPGALVFGPGVHLISLVRAHVGVVTDDIERASVFVHEWRVARPRPARRHRPASRRLRGPLPRRDQQRRRGRRVRRRRSRRDRRLHPVRAQRPRRLVPPGWTARTHGRSPTPTPTSRCAPSRPGAGHDRPARSRTDPRPARARPPGVQRGPAARRALRAVRGARGGRAQDRGDRLDARRVPDGRPALRRDARQQRADGRPARARMADAGADPAAEAGPDRQGPGRGRARPAALPRGRGPRQAARGDVRRPAGREDQVPQRLPLPDRRLGRRRDDRLAGGRRRDRRPAGAARLVVRAVRPDDAQDLLGGIGPHHARA